MPCKEDSGDAEPGRSQHVSEGHLAARRNRNRASELYGEGAGGSAAESEFGLFSLLRIWVQIRANCCLSPAHQPDS